MIIHIVAPKALLDKALIIGTALRNSQVGQAKGGLLVAVKDDAEPRYLLEKIIAAEPLPEKPVAATKVPWKPDSMIVLINGAVDLLDDFEKLVPGFGKRFGPPTKITLT